MTRLSVALGTICCLGFGAASAAELAPQSGYSIHLGGMDGTVYYTVQADGYRVVATVASAEGSPIRFTSTLKAGQRMVISIPQAVDQAATRFRDPARRRRPSCGRTALRDHRRSRSGAGRPRPLKSLARARRRRSSEPRRRIRRAMRRGADGFRAICPRTADRDSRARRRARSGQYAAGQRGQAGRLERR